MQVRAGSPRTVIVASSVAIVFQGLFGREDATKLAAGRVGVGPQIPEVDEAFCAGATSTVRVVEHEAAVLVGARHAHVPVHAARIVHDHQDVGGHARRLVEWYVGKVVGDRHLARVGRLRRRRRGIDHDANNVVRRRADALVVEQPITKSVNSGEVDGRRVDERAGRAVEGKGSKGRQNGQNGAERRTDLVASLIEQFAVHVVGSNEHAIHG